MTGWPQRVLPKQTELPRRRLRARRNSFHQQYGVHLHIALWPHTQTVRPSYRISFGPVASRPIPSDPAPSHTVLSHPMSSHGIPYRPIPLHTLASHAISHLTPTSYIPARPRPHQYRSISSHTVPSHPIPYRSIEQAPVRGLRPVHLAVRGGVGLPRLGEAAGVQGRKRGRDRGRHRSSRASCGEGGLAFFAVSSGSINVLRTVGEALFSQNISQ